MTFALVLHLLFVGRAFSCFASIFGPPDYSDTFHDVESFSVISEGGSKVGMNKKELIFIEWDFDGSTDGWEKTTKKSGSGLWQIIAWKQMSAKELDRMDIVNRDMSKNGKGMMMVAMIREKPPQGTHIYGSIRWQKLLNTKDYPCMCFSFHMRDTFMSLQVLAFDPNSHEEILLWQRDGLDSGYASGLPRDIWMYWEIPLADFPDLPLEFNIIVRAMARFRWIRNINFLAIDRMRFLTRKCLSKFRKTKLSCGKSSIPGKKIYGGKTSDRGNWPWIVRIHYFQKRRKSSCGGALIAPRWVLTASHCIIDKSVNENYELTFHEYIDGVWDNLLYTLIPEELFTTTQFDMVEHISYTEVDMALIKLPYALTSSDGVINPLCIGGNAFVNPDDQVTFLGWGSDGTNIKKRVMQEVNLTVTSCYRSHNFCTRQNGKDVCRGDSGGPGMIHMNDSWHHVGLVESGPICPEAGTGTNVYTAKVWRWIKHIITNY